jgi:hypothetical protein
MDHGKFRALHSGRHLSVIPDGFHNGQGWLPRCRPLMCLPSAGNDSTAAGLPLSLKSTRRQGRAVSVDSIVGTDSVSPVGALGEPDVEGQLFLFSESGRVTW